MPRLRRTRSGQLPDQASHPARPRDHPPNRAGWSASSPDSGRQRLARSSSAAGLGPRSILAVYTVMRIGTPSSAATSSTWPSRAAPSGRTPQLLRQLAGERLLGGLPRLRFASRQIEHAGRGLLAHDQQPAPIDDRRGHHPASHPCPSACHRPRAPEAPPAAVGARRSPPTSPAVPTHLPSGAHPNPRRSPPVARRSECRHVAALGCPP
jgi:hypothetical protein